MKNTIEIGGIERGYSVTYGYFGHVMDEYRKYYKTAINIFYKTNGVKFDIDNDDHTMVIHHDFFFGAVWGALMKTRGIFKKPFRSIKSMIKKINMDDYPGIVGFAGTVIFSSKDKTTQGGKSEDNKPLSLVEYFELIDEAYLYQRYRLRAFCGYNENEIDGLSIERGKMELEWVYDNEMKNKIDMFSSHGIDVRDVKKMGTSFYRDYILKKQRADVKDDTPEEINKFKDGFDGILKSKRGKE